MATKRTTKLTEALATMNKTDIYSMMLFVLYKLKNQPDYLALSELCYLLDGDDLTKLLSYYGGMTITIPTMRDLRLVMQALYLYQFVNLNGGDFREGMKMILNSDASAEFSADEIKKTYTKILEVLDNYEFDRGQN